MTTKQIEDFDTLVGNADGEEWLIIQQADGTTKKVRVDVALASGGGGDMAIAVYDPAGMAEQAVGLTEAQTVTNKTLTSPVINTAEINGSLTGDAVLDENDLVSDSDTKLATQQSIKAYVDTTADVQLATTDVSTAGWVVDEDNMASDLNTKVPTQQSTKAYADAVGAAQVSLTGGTMSGTLDMGDNIIQDVVLKNYSETYQMDAGVSTTHNVDLDDGNIQEITFAATTIVSFTNPSASAASSVTCILINAGSYTVTFPGVIWAGGVAPVFTSSGTDVVSFVITPSASQIFGFVGGLDFT